MKFPQLAYCVLFFYFGLLGSCSTDNDKIDEEISISDDLDSTDDSESTDDSDATDDSGSTDDSDSTDDSGTTDLSARFVFGENLVIEHSWNTGGCDSPPCDTDEDGLVNIFIDAVPDDPYFYLSTDESELNLECQLDKGRRAEFKQGTEGPLTSFSKIEFEGIYYDIPNNGVTIAQVHNRGGNSNKPFFRLVLHEDGLETVIRKDPEVSSSDTTFQKEDFSFTDGADYDLSSIKVVLEKSGGVVNISVENNGEVLLEESYAPDTTTDWVNDSGIANGFYLKAGLYNDDGPHTKNLVVGYSTVIFSSDDQ